MKELLERHPDMKESLELYPDGKIYKILDSTYPGGIKEYWEKDKNGHWVDQTQREHLKIAIAKEKEELEKLKCAERLAIAKVKEAQKKAEEALNAK